MIILYHNDEEATLVWDEQLKTNILFKASYLPDLLFELAASYPDRMIIWCHTALRDYLNREELGAILNHQKMLISYCPNGNWLPEQIGYVEDSAFIKVQKQKRFPTWRMSSAVGGTHASLLTLFKNNGLAGRNLNYFLNSAAKLGMPLGLYCYSEPRLLTRTDLVYNHTSSFLHLFRFVRQHYKITWSILLMLNMLMFERRFPIRALMQSLFFRRRKLKAEAFQNIIMAPQELVKTDLDVIIPTIGRKVFLYDVLKNLASQTLLPKRIIIVEQNPAPGSTSELHYLKTEDWPFIIVHIFTHQSGACNARNIALDQTESNWVFFADDDIYIAPDFIEQVFEKISLYPNQVFNVCCLQKDSLPSYTNVHLTSIFATGCSFALREAVSGLRFDMNYEFGYGEDSDFGMQLISKGIDICYLPKPSILHLQAPVGGFRIKHKFEWSTDLILPKPSPTIMLYKIKYNTTEQIRGYRTVLFAKFYRHQTLRNPIAYLNDFNKRWRRSEFLAEQLLKKSRNE